MPKESLVMKIFNRLFTKRSKIAYIRFIVLLFVLVVSFTIIQNVGCGFKDGKFWFEWQPAADIRIEK